MTAALLSLFGTAATMSLLIIVLFALSKAIGGRLKASARRLIWALVMLRLCLPVSGFLPAFITLELPSRAAVSQTSDATAPPVAETTAALTTQPAAPVTERRIETTARTETSAAIASIETASVRQVESSPSTVPPVKSEMTSQAPSTAAETSLPAPEPKLSVSEAPETPVEPRHITPEDLAKPIAVIWILGGICCFSAMMLSNARVTAAFSGSLSEPPAGLLTDYSALCEKSRIKRRPALRVSAKVKSPLLFRLTRPTIVVPRDLVGSDNLLPMLSHELTHYRSGDLWLKLISAVAVAIWWWNPLVRAASKRLGDEIELACDEKVLDGVSESARVSYGDAMLKVVKSFRDDHIPSGLTTQYSPTGKSLKKRLDNILDSSKKRRGYFLIALTVLACVFASGFVSCRQAEPIVSVSADDQITAQGSVGGFSYNVYNNYIGISGTTDLKVTYESGNDRKLIIPDIIDGLPVAKLEDGFMHGELSAYSEVDLPQTLVWIGDGALSSETAWNGKITIPDTVSHIGKGALANVSFESDSNGYIIVGDGLLIGYTGAGGELTLPASVRVISGAFTNNKNISSVRVNNGCTTLSDSAFAFSGITEVTLPDSVKSIGRDCFRGSELTNIRMPSGDCSIGRFAFETAGQTLTLTVAENSSAMLWAIENDIPCRIEKTGKNVDPDSLEAVGAGEHDFTDDGKKVNLRVNEQLISADRKRAAVVTYDGDLPDTLRIVDLRTLRVTDKLVLGKNELMRAIDGYPDEERDYSDCGVTGSFEPSGWSDGVLKINAELVISHESDSWQITAEFSYTPGSGYLSTDSIRTNTLLPDYLSGYDLLTETVDGSAKLYGKREGDKFGAPLIIRWTYGSISVSDNSITPDSSPSLELADMNGDGLNDIILTWTESGDGTSKMRAEVFFGPTGSKRVLIDPCADFGEKAKLESRPAGVYIVSEVGEEYIASSNNPDDIVIGERSDIKNAGDYLIADLSIRESDEYRNELVRMVYRYIDGEMKLGGIFTTLSSQPVLSDEIASLWHVGRNDSKDSYLLISNGVERVINYAMSGSVQYRLDHTDLDGDGIQDTAVIFSFEPGTAIGGDLHTEECFILTSSDGKLREINAPNDIKDLFTITNNENSWHFKSRFGEFDISKYQFDLTDAYFYDTKVELEEIPLLENRYFYRLSGDSVICDAYIDCTGFALNFAAETLRLTYRLDSFFRVKSADVISADTTELSFDFETMMNYLSDARSTTKRNDQITVNLTDRGKPTLNISFDDGYPTLVSVKAKNQTLTFEAPLNMLGNLKIDIYEAGGNLVVESLYYDFGDTYIISDDAIIRNYSEYGQKTEDYLTFSEKDGRLAYTRTATRYNPIDLGQSGFYYVLDTITSRDDFWKETGTVEIVDGGLALTPEETFTIADYTDLDEGFKKFNDYVANYNSLDEVIERNVRRLTPSTAPTAISVTFGEFITEVDRLIKSGTSRKLIATITDVENAVLTVEKSNSGTFLTRVEARGAVLDLTTPAAFDDSPEITLFAAGELTALQIVYQNGACDRYIFGDSISSEWHDSASDSMEFTTRWFKQNDQVRFEKKSTGNMRLILSNLTSRGDIYSESGYMERDYDIGVDFPRVIEKERTFEDAYDLDAEFEKYKSELGDYRSLDSMLALKAAARSGYTDVREMTVDELRRITQGEPGDKFAADVGIAVVMMSVDSNRTVYIDGMAARGYYCKPYRSIRINDSVSFDIFEADGYVVLAVVTGSESTENIIFSTFDEPADYISHAIIGFDDLLYFYEKDGKLAYTMLNPRYRDTEPLNGIVNIISRNDTYKVEGVVTRTALGIELHNKKMYSLKEVFDLDKVFSENKDTYFKGFDTLDDVIEYNNGKTELTLGDIEFRTVRNGCRIVSSDKSVNLLVRVTESDIKTLFEFDGQLTDPSVSYSAETDASGDVILTFTVTSGENTFRLKRIFHSAARTLDADFTPIDAVLGEKTKALAELYYTTYEANDMGSAVFVGFNPDVSTTHVWNGKELTYYKVDDPRFEKYGITSLKKLANHFSESYSPECAQKLTTCFDGGGYTYPGGKFGPELIEKGGVIWRQGDELRQSGEQTRVFTSSGNTLNVRFLSTGKQQAIPFIESGGKLLCDAIIPLL